LPAGQDLLQCQLRDLHEAGWSVPCDRLPARRLNWLTRRGDPLASAPASGCDPDLIAYFGVCANLADAAATCGSYDSICQRWRRMA
jgi:hypothetical protein